MTEVRFDSSTGERIYTPSGELAICEEDSPLCKQCDYSLYQEAGMNGWVETENYDSIPPSPTDDCDIFNGPYFSYTGGKYQSDDDVGNSPLAAGSSLYRDVAGINPLDYSCLSIQADVSYTDDTRHVGIGIAGNPGYFWSMIIRNSSGILTKVYSVANTRPNTCPQFIYGTLSTIASSPVTLLLTIRRISTEPRWFLGEFCANGVQIFTGLRIKDDQLNNPFRPFIRHVGWFNPSVATFDNLSIKGEELEYPPTILSSDARNAMPGGLANMVDAHDKTPEIGSYDDASIIV